MAPLGYIEVLDSKGRVSERYPVESFPVRVGRSYTNQVILDDPFVCPEHVAITQNESGQFTVDDLGSVNGLRRAEDTKPVKTLTLESGSKFRIGHTNLRYCTADTPIAATQLDRVDLLSRLATPHAALLAGLLVLAALAVDFYLGSFDRVTFLRAATDPLVTISTMVVWAGLWAFVSRIVFGRLYYTQHFIIVCVAMLASLLFNESSEWLEFVVPSIPFMWLTGVFGSALILAAAVFAHLRFASSMRWPARVWSGLLASAAVIGVGVISDYASREKFSTAMEYSGIVKPINEELVPAGPLEPFMSRVQAMKKDLDLLAMKAKSTQP